MVGERGKEESENREKNIGKGQKLIEKLEEGKRNNKKDGKEVMMELDINSHVEDTGRLPLNELNQNSRVRYERERL